MPIAYSCRDRIGHTDSRVPKSAGSAQRSRGVSASLANAAAPVVSYPKGTSKKYSCDFNRDDGWEVLRQAGFDGVRQVAIDDDWSALRFRRFEFIKQSKQ